MLGQSTGRSRMDWRKSPTLENRGWAPVGSGSFRWGLDLNPAIWETIAATGWRFLERWRNLGF